MTIKIKGLLAALFGIAAALPGFAVAQEYPSKPVRIIVTSTAGGPTDIVARTLAAYLEKRFKQPFIAEAHPGADGLIALTMLSKSAPDGYTVAVAQSGFPHKEATDKTWNLKFGKDFTVLSIFVGGGAVLIVPTSLPITNLQELVAYAKANPGKLNQATVGDKPQEAVTAIWRKLGIDSLLTNITYKGGGPASQAVAAGEAHLWTAGLGDAMNYSKAGKVRMLAYTELERSPLAPNLPTLQEVNPDLAGYRFDFWFALAVPVGVPAAVSDKLLSATRDATREAEFRNRVSAFGMHVMELGPEASQDRIVGDMKREIQFSASNKP